MTTAVAKPKAKDEAAEPPAPPPKEVEPRGVQINDAGQAFRTVLVRLPKAIGVDNLRDPKIWRKVQLTPQTALIKLDNLMILSFDESQIVRAVVTHASSDEAHLCIERVGPF